ncbi:MAG: tetratricopeptide repeat protein [Spirochaetales bacterium]|nr:tetratricopeptide repeat protein [Spirochaetales bacterium]
MGCKRMALMLAVVSLSPLFAAPSSARDEVVRGTQALQADDPYAAVDAFRGALRVNPDYVDARVGMAQALFLLGEYEEAAREAAMARPLAQNDRSLTLLEARIATAQMRYDEALLLYQGILAQRPHDTEANRGLAEVYALTGQEERAGEALRQSLRHVPGDLRTLLQLTVLHDAAREQEEAAAVLERALRLYPENISVRAQAAEHAALYGDWETADFHLERALRFLSGPQDPRFQEMAILQASLQLRKGDPAAALTTLETMKGEVTRSTLYLMARASREVGNEEAAQNVAQRLLGLYPDDEIARLFREAPLVSSYSNHDLARNQAASWRLTQGAKFEDKYLYNRAFDEYRRARMIDKDSPEAWVAYLRILDKMGYRQLYEESLSVALAGDIQSGTQERPSLERDLELLQHGRVDTLADLWGITNPWNRPQEWRLAVFVFENQSSLPLHDGAQNLLAERFADLVDQSPDVQVIQPQSGFFGAATVKDFPEAFTQARGKTDYFAILRFDETQRSFSGGYELYLSRTGESVRSSDGLRTGEGRVSGVLDELSRSLSQAIPRVMRILQVEDDRILADKGSWYSVASDEVWTALAAGTATPSRLPAQVDYDVANVLGTVQLQRVSEALSEGLFVKQGDFDFVAPGDELFLMEAPAPDSQQFLAPDPALRRRLLSIP